MSVQGEIDRINRNLTEAYSALSELGADSSIPSNSDNLARSIESIQAVLYKSQSLNETQKTQARLNIGAASSDHKYSLSELNLVLDQNQYGESVPAVDDLQENEIYFVEQPGPSLLNLVYPIGSIYMSVNNVSPQDFLGGTWERIQDQFLLAAGDSYGAGSTGGEAEHTLTVDEMPSHNHGAHTHVSKNVSGSGYDSSVSALQDWWKTDSGDDIVRINAAGGGAAHNNMPPYLAVYVWKRTA